MTRVRIRASAGAKEISGAKRKMTKPVVGIDVGKEKLDVGLNGSKRVRDWANDETGFNHH